MNWISRQGGQRSSNNDAAAVGFHDQYLVAILVDAADKGANGQGLARHWAQRIVEGIVQSDEPLIHEMLLRKLRQEQLKLRHHYLIEIASYCLVWLDMGSGVVQGLYTGDCLAGTNANDQTKWCITPHTVSQQHVLSQGSQLPMDPSYRHLLTRSLNAKRFSIPDYFTSALSTGGNLLLCSDGYWFEHLEQGNPLDALDDDASLLRLTFTADKVVINQQTDCDNLILIQR